jgi:hypothetical protein
MLLPIPLPVILVPAAPLPLSRSLVVSIVAVLCQLLLLPFSLPGFLTFSMTAILLMTNRRMGGKAFLAIQACLLHIFSKTIRYGKV